MPVNRVLSNFKVFVAHTLSSRIKLFPCQNSCPVHIQQNCLLQPHFITVYISLKVPIQSSSNMSTGNDAETANITSKLP
jgi:hypothetical protein